MAEIELWGEKFTLHPDGISEYALLEFSVATRDAQDDDADTPAGMAALLDLVLDTLAEDQRKRFRVAARKNRAKALDLMKVVEAAGEDVADRPTSPPADSSVGHIRTVPKSETVYEKAERLRPGRPDLQVPLVRAALVVASG